MFATVATTAIVNPLAAQRRGRAVSLLLMSETSELLLGSGAGGWLFQQVGSATPFLFEATCMAVAAVVVALWASPPAERRTIRRRSGDRRLLASVLRTPGVLLMGVTSAVLIAIQTGIVVFLLPLYLSNRAALEPEAVGLVVGLGVLGRLVALWLGGGLSDRWGRMRALIPGLVVYAAFLGSLSLLTHPMALGAWSFALGAAAGFVAPIPTTLMSDQVAPALQGVAVGWLRTMTDGGQIVGPLAMGALADAVDLSAPFFVGAALLAASAWRCVRRAKAITGATVGGARNP
jgi:predicted MFS family arabinose efflux permease